MRYGLIRENIIADTKNIFRVMGRLDLLQQFNTCGGNGPFHEIFTQLADTMMMGN